MRPCSGNYRAWFVWRTRSARLLYFSFDTISPEVTLTVRNDVNKYIREPFVSSPPSLTLSTSAALSYNISGNGPAVLLQEQQPIDIHMRPASILRRRDLRGADVLYSRPPMSRGRDLLLRQFRTRHIQPLRFLYGRLHGSYLQRSSLSAAMQ